MNKKTVIKMNEMSEIYKNVRTAHTHTYKLNVLIKFNIFLFDWL